MRKLKVGKLALGLFVLVVLGGCGREHAQSAALPAVISNSPANGATGVVVNTAVSVGFSVVKAPATINTSNAAKDLAGNVLTAGSIANPWSFTTGASVGPVGPNLGTASTFGAFGGGAGITN